METLLKRLDKVLDSFIGERIAAFDLDDTLTDGDTGDAFFLYLKYLEKSEPLREDSTPIPFTWEEYQKVLNTEGKEAAFSKVVSVMGGISEKKLRTAAGNFYTDDLTGAEVDGMKIDIPRPNEFMGEFINELKARKFRIVIISASNQYIVNTTAMRFFNISSEDCFAINPEVDERGIATTNLQFPVPITTGKAEIYRSFTDCPPLVTAGNSDTDIHLLNLVHQEGIPIWCNSDVSTFPKMEKLIECKDNFTFIRR